MTSRKYGGLEVALAFSIWLYWTGFMILVCSQFQCRTPISKLEGEWRLKRNDTRMPNLAV